MRSDDDVSCFLVSSSSTPAIAALSSPYCLCVVSVTYVTNMCKMCYFLQVLEELGDIIDLPMRAAAVEELMNAGGGCAMQRACTSASRCRLSSFLHIRCCFW